MAANSSITLTSLDFDSLKSSLKTYLQSQSELKDYNFDSSNMSVLLDVLAYNTYMNSFYLNMLGSEMFLDSAQLRDSIVSHAKELNYLPRSFNSAHAEVNITITSTDTSKNSITIPKGTKFISRVGDQAYTFVTNEYIVITNNAGTFLAENVKIYEGDILNDTFVVDYSDPLVYKIFNPQIDISSITVRVIENNGADTLIYNRATSLFGFDEDSQIFFVQPALNGSYEIVFGDGVVGRRPLNGAIVLVEYRVCNGELPNGANKFVSAGRIDNENNISIYTVTSAIGGSVAETIDSIKYNAPRAFTTQERAITTEDYENILKLNFPEINSVSAYGGEDVTPPQYGRVFISIDLSDVDGLPIIKKNEYLSFLRTRAGVTMEPVFIQPEYTYLDVKSTIKYNINITGRNPEDIKTSVMKTILKYAFTNLNGFNKTFRYSKLISDIDDSEKSIISNETEVRMIKYITPSIEVYQNIYLDFKTPLDKKGGFLPDTHPVEDLHTLQSSQFTYSGIKGCLLEDDGNGRVRIILVDGPNHKIIAYVGFIDYDTGVVILNNFKISDFTGLSLKIYCSPANKDISSQQNIVLNVIESDITINVEQFRQ